jgi:uncharacterized alkaline shock family protein YloU
MGDNKGYIKSADDRGSVNISEEVIAIISAVAAIEVEGVSGLFISPGKELTNVVGRKGLSRGVKLFVEGDDVTIDVHVVAEIGVPVSEMGVQVQKAVISAVESAAGIKIAAVNVHVCGIALRK